MDYNFKRHFKYNRIKYFIVLIGILCSYSCGFNFIDNTNSKPNNVYQKGLDKFDNKYVDHFPSNDDNAIFFGYGTDSKVADYRVAFYQKKDKSDIKQYEDSISNIALEVYKAGNKCNFVVNPFTNKDNYFEQNRASRGYRKVLNRECLNDKLPIPNFWRKEIKSNNNICNLPDDFDIYVLDAYKGTAFDKKYLSRAGSFVPEFWKHGYSKGVAISTKRNIVIYWFIIW